MSRYIGKVVGKLNIGSEKLSVFKEFNIKLVDTVNTKNEDFFNGKDSRGISAESILERFFFAVQVL